MLSTPYCVPRMTDELLGRISIVYEIIIIVVVVVVVVVHKP